MRFIKNINSAKSNKPHSVLAPIWSTLWLIFLPIMVVGLAVGGLFDESYYIFHTLIFLIIILSIKKIHNAAQNNRDEFVLFFFALAFCVFHFGIVPVYIFIPDDIETIGFNLFLWYLDSELMVPAYSLALVFLIGINISLFIPIKKKWRVNNVKYNSDKNIKIARYCTFVMSIFIVIWFYIVILSGYGKYDIYLEGMQDSGRSAIIGLIHSGIGISFILATTMTRDVRLTIYVFGVWALFAFPLGLRSHVVFPIFVSLALIASQGRLQIKLWKTILLALIFLTISSSVAALRISTSEENFANSISIIRGIAELGGSIRPAYEVINWLSTGDFFQLGTTYIAPFERSFLRIFPVIDRIPAEVDFRLMNVLIENRAGPYGFSIAAEAYYNFGYGGCLFVGIVSGCLSRFVGSMANANKFNPIIFPLVFAIFIHIRQSFVSSFGIFIGAIFILSMIWVALIVMQKKRGL